MTSVTQIGRREAAAPHVMIVGGPDVDARLELMGRLRGPFTLGALGTSPAIGGRFAMAGFAYGTYSTGAGLSPAGDLRGLAELVALLRRAQPAIVHAFATRPCVWGRIAARLAGVPVVVGTLPGLGSLYAGDGPRVRAARAAYRPLQRLACRLADRTIFQNGDDLRQLVAEGVVAPERALVIPGSGVPTALYAQGRVGEEERARARAELGLRSGEVVVTMIARVIRSKGVMEFARAARELAAQGSPARFVLVGPAVESSVDRLSAAELAELRLSVTWPGPRRDVAAVLAVSDLFVLPSAYREGVPRALLEAAAMGLPLVSTDTPGCRDVVADGENGLLVPPGDAAALAAAVGRLAAAPELRRLMGPASRRRAVERFDLDVVAARTAELYQTLLAQRGLAPAPA